MIISFADNTFLRADYARVDIVDHFTQYSSSNAGILIGTDDTIEKLDLDDNTWKFSLSGNILNINVTSSDNTVLFNRDIADSSTNQLESLPYRRLLYMSYDDDNSLCINWFGLYGSNIRSRQDIRACGVLGVTTCTAESSSIVEFPKEGLWPANTNLQRALDYFSTTYSNDSSYDVNWIVMNCTDNVFGCDFTFKRRHNTSFSGTFWYGGIVMFTVDQCNTWFPNTIDTAYSNDISNAIITLDKYSWVYTGYGITPTVNVVLNNTTLIEDTDYLKTYENNIDVGTAAVLIAGINNYRGSKRVNFTIVSADDPYEQGGTTEPEGGNGDFDNESDTISEPALPTLSALNSKFITIWTPTLSELQAFASWFYSTDLLNVQTYIKTVANPIDYIQGLSIVPLNISYTQSNVYIGMVNSNISMRRALVQYITLDCGTVDINEYWGSYLDYTPYTKIDVFLPYIGFRTLDPDVIMGTTVNIKYHCDILSGACVAFIIANGTVAYSFGGNISMQIPISAADFTSIIKTVASIAGVGASAILAGAGAAKGIAGSFLSTADKISTVAKEAGSIVGASAGSLANNVISTKQHVLKSGAITGETGIFANKKPYLVINRPRQAVASQQNVYTGYPGFMTVTLNTLAGFTVVSDIHIEGSFCTQDELFELERILKSGFIV